MNLSNLISYYKDCYQADTRTLSVNNFFSNKVEHRLYIEGKDELLNGNLPYYPITDEYAEEVQKTLTLYKREKVFYCAAFFVIGQEETALKKDSKICAPVYLYPAEIVTIDELKYVRLDVEKRVININCLNALKKEEVQDLYEGLAEVPVVIGDYGDAAKIKRVLEEKLEDFSGDDIVSYPQLYKDSKIKQLLYPASLEKRDKLGLIPAIAFGVLKRSTATQGIITELNQIIKSADFSAPLRAVLGEEIQQSVQFLSAGKVPAILSPAQNEVLESVNKHTATMVIGPPGTGKSFTIAAVAIDFLSKGKSVLIASKTDQAVDVILKKIETDLCMPGVAMRAGKSDYKKDLKNHLNALLTKSRRMPKDSTTLEEVAKKLKVILKQTGKYHSQFNKQVDNELRWAKYVSEYSAISNLFSRLKIRYIKWRNAQQLPHWHLTRRFLENYLNQIRYTKELVQMTFQHQVHQALYNSRSMFRDFEKSLSARMSSRQESLFRNIDMNYLLRTFPIWLVNVSDVHGALPLRKELFDLVIIDEASQCDIAGCLPVIQRAKRVMIVGDPKQLRHASFLSRSVQYALQRKNSIEGDVAEVHLDYRSTSILDLMNDRIGHQNQVCFLDEHFRSKPDIIRFSNREFYNDSLKVMTNVPGKEKAEHLIVVRCGGIRDKQGVNRMEAKLVLSKIKELITRQESLDHSTCQSIGVLSPFRDQVEHLSKLIQEEIDVRHIEKHDIACGTAYSFQGEERDIMMLSFAIDDDCHHSALIHLNKPDVFNVAVTRARTLQYLFISFSEEFNPGEYLSKYLSDINSVSDPRTEELMKIRDHFLESVKKRLEQDGYETWVGFSMAGLFVDLVFKRADGFYGINLIGYPGMFVDAFTVEDYKILTRAGLPVFPLPYTYWEFEEEKCYNELMAFAET